MSSIKKYMNITILTDNPTSWIIPYVDELKKHLVKLKFNVTHITNHKDIKEGDIMFILSCEKILPKEKLKFHKHNIVVHPSKLPEGNFDGIISFDVLEHIPEEEIPQVIKEIFERANKFVFLGIDTSPAEDILPNGENAHCTQKPLEWWVDMIKTHGKKVYTHVMTNGQYEGYEILNDELYFEML